MLVDPVILKPYDAKEQEIADQRMFDLVIGALSRRDTWPSKYAANSHSVYTHPDYILGRKLSKPSRRIHSSVAGIQKFLRSLLNVDFTIPKTPKVGR